jgi:hypothetical protein
MDLEVPWDGLWTLLLVSHNLMVVALGSCVKWPLITCCMSQEKWGSQKEYPFKTHVPQCKATLIVQNSCVGEVEQRMEGGMP